MNNLQKELQELKAKVADLESRIVVEPVKWQPKGGRYYVALGEIYDGGDEDVGASFGIRRETFYQASRAASEMRKFNRLLALRDELCGDEVGDWKDIDIRRYYLFFNHNKGKWASTYDDTCYETITHYFTSKGSAQKACDMLNSGEVEL
jgi:hypothetical protein